MTRSGAPAAPAAEPTLPAPTFWSLFCCALAALGLLWMPLVALQWIDGLLVMKRPIDVLRDLALWWPLVLVPVTLIASVAWLSAVAVRLRMAQASAALLAWSVLLLPVLWLCGWQFSRTVWLWFKLQTGITHGVAPGLRIAAVVVLLLFLVALLRLRGAVRVVRWPVETLLTLRVPAAIVLVLAGAITLWRPPVLNWSGSTARPAGAAAAVPDAPDVLLITLDAVAAEDAGVCGNGPTMMPRLRAFARQRGSCYSRFYAGGNFTTPTTSTMETGTLPWRHLAVQPDARIVEHARDATLAQALRRAGYQTVAVTDNLLASPRQRGTYVGYDRNELLPTALLGELLREAVTVFPDSSLPRLTTSALGLLGAFDVRHHGERSPYESQRIYDRAWQLIEQATNDKPRRPLFLWAHTMPPHSPYLSPLSTRHQLLPAGELERWQDLLPDNIEYPPDLQPLVDKHRLRYRESMLAADQALGDFLDRLERAGRLDRTLIIVSSDHGESFEHGYIGHAGPKLHDALLRVPLVVKLPGQTSPRMIDVPASQADLAPTVLDLVGAAPLPTAEGRSLRAVLEGASLEARPVFAMTMERQSRFKPLRDGNYTVIDGALKLVWDLPHDRSELYDLLADPHERVDLAPQQPSTVERLRALLRARLDEAERQRTQGLTP